MKYFKYMMDELPNWKTVAEKALSYYYEHHDEYLPHKIASDFQFCEADKDDILEKIPEIAEMLNHIDATLHFVIFYEIEKSFDPNERIHIDNAPFNTRILIPLLNCEGSESRYYVSSKELRYMIEVADLEVDRCVPKVPLPGTCSHVDSYYIERGPVLMTPNNLHSVMIPEDSNFPRVVMMVMTNEDLLYKLK